MSHYLVQPVRRVDGAVRVPGDKSISHRALMLGGIAEGVTEVHEVMHIDRGYPHFVEDLQKLGGQIERVGRE